MRGGGGVNTAIAQSQTIRLTADRVTHESFRLIWTPDTATDTIEFEDSTGVWSPATMTGASVAVSQFSATAATTIFSPANFVTFRTTPLRIRIRDLKGLLLDTINAEVSNAVTITLQMPDGTGGSVMGNPPPAMPDPGDPPGGGDDNGGNEMVGETETPPADNTAADKAVLPRVLHGIQRGIFNRILQRQREDGKWK